MAMSNYSVAEAKNNLPKLLDRALAGEAVTITRRGKVIARIVPSGEAAPGVAEDGPRAWNDIDWLRRVRVHPKNQDPYWDSDQVIRRMRDEGY
jgi:prevent-host-death family protein